MTDWSQYVAYKCRWRRCQDDCINRVDSPAALTKQCWQCYHRNDRELVPLTDHLPDEYAPRLDADARLDATLIDQREPVKSRYNR